MVRRWPLLVVVALVAACTHTSPARVVRDPEVVLVAAGGAELRVKVEVARTPEETQRGLMFRDHLDDGKGMLFLFPEPRKLQFWMHNTYIPLDMIFITSEMKILGVVEKATPLTDDPRGPAGVSQYVLEVPGGWAGVHGVRAGGVVRFVGVDD